MYINHLEMILRNHKMGDISNIYYLQGFPSAGTNHILGKNACVSVCQTTENNSGVRDQCDKI